ncbi:MAG: heterodisulfide reductase, partial [Promethearchaeota archaeon]
KINSIDGYIGNFTTEIIHGEEKETTNFDHGIIIVATGANEYEPEDNEYFFGQNDKVITQSKLEELLFSNENNIKKLRSIVMIQCVGSRNEEHPYCSRMCCSEAIKNAIKIKELNPAINVTVLFRDIRTYGFKEKYYRMAREKGILFLRFDEKNPPEIKTEDSLFRVEVITPSKDIIYINSDLIVLSAGIVAPEENSELAKKLKVPLNEDNFFLEAHVKLRPSD